MRLVVVRPSGGEARAGLLEGDEVFVSEFESLEAVIRHGVDLRRAKGVWRPTAELAFEPPLRPAVVFCSGNNYLDHNAERTRLDTSRLEFFLKAGQTIAELDAPLSIDPRVIRKLDQETELGVVIGKAARNVPDAQARTHIFGYMVANDVTARERQVIRRPDGSFSMELGSSKNFDGATRLSRAITTADEIPDPQDLLIETLVNGHHRQRNSTRNMLNGVDALVSRFSEIITLPAGAVISTGTPGGTGWGQDSELGGNGRTPPECVAAAYLESGDVVESRIEGLEPLRFTVSYLEGPPSPPQA